MFSNSDIAAYYDTTEIHYRKWWKLADHLSLHYGVWSPGVGSFTESLRETNKVMAAAVGVREEDRVLDAGCGVGGAAIYLAETYSAHVQGITLSAKQVATATTNAQRSVVANRVQFTQADFTNTLFEEASFTVVWACESVCHAADKADFLKEAHRLLEPGGRLVVFDFFSLGKDDPKQWMKRWGDTWGVPHYAQLDKFLASASDIGFEKVETTDYTSLIEKSARRLYWAAKLGAIPSRLYNITHPGVSRFAKTHFLSGIYQYRALKAGLWQYALVTAEKPH